MGEFESEASIKFHCRDCGDTIQWRDDTADDDIIVCGRCGKEFGTFADLKALAFEHVAKRARDHLSGKV